MTRITSEEFGDSGVRYQHLFETSPDPTFVFDRHTHSVLDFNDAAVRDYGYRREELAALECHDIWPLIELSALFHTNSELPQYLPTELPVEHRKRDGSFINVEVIHHVMVFGGRPAWVMVARNISDRIVLEEELRQLQKVDAIGKLAGVIAHDFNNLLTVINGYSDLALAGMPEGDSFRTYIEGVREAGDHAVELTRQLLALSRKQVLVPVVLDINVAIEGLKRMLARLIREDIEVCFELAHKLEATKADPSQIEQIVINLVINACDAMPSGGKVTIRTQNIVLNGDDMWHDLALKAGSHIVLEITDTGHGMDAETQARMFTPFFTTKEVGKGTGLGLSTVYGIVKRSGGGIRVHSEVGRGTTFEICFPSLGQMPICFPQSRECRRDLRGSETILVTEDDDTLRKLTSQALSLYGYRVLVAASGHAAIAICEHQTDSVDLLITDIVMPGMNGRDLVQRIQELRPEAAFLIMSGYTGSEFDHEQMVNKGIPFIQKPFAVQSLVSKVREILDKAGPKCR